ncbi:MAG: S41 family peptidase [Lachnospiraceae bacterium]|nr:S41 family peptidase [Lachnospiraceae bacterium]
MDFQEKNQNKKNNDTGVFFSGLLVGVLATIALVGVIALGVVAYNVFVVAPKAGEQQALQDLQADAEGGMVDTEMMEKLEALEAIIDIYYYKDDLEQEALEEGVYRGLMEAVGDPYTCYYTEEEVEELWEQTIGVYYGIGAYVSLDETGLYPMITSPIAGSPAEEADLRPGDILYEVNGESTYGMDLDSVVALIKGEEGTTVDLTIARSSENDYLYVTVERRRVEAPSVNSEMFDNGMAYIQITEFSDATVDQFADALATAKGAGMKGLIIDLRANPGGALSSVVNIARMLLPKGLIVYTEDKYGERDEYSCDGKNEFKLPLVVLVDGNSASASEVLAGAIKDYGIGTLVGTTTFGKGIVQQIIDIKDGSAVKVTTSSYYSPKGTNIHGTGIEPDIVCEFDGEAYYNEDYDNQLEYAKEVLAGMIK